MDGAFGHAERLGRVGDRPALEPDAFAEQGSPTRQKPSVAVNLYGSPWGAVVSTPSLKEALLTNVDGIYS